MAIEGIYGVLCRFCDSCSYDDLDTYTSELWYVCSDDVKYG